MPARSYLFSRPPVWHSHPTSQQRQTPPALQSWLNETGSLTKRLRGIYGGSFRVSVLFNRWKPAFVDECQLLGLPAHRNQLIREVILYANDTPLVLARTVLPEQTIKIAQSNLSHLGNRPLGEVLFSYPDLQRWQRQFSCAQPAVWTLALQQQVAVEQNVWGRRTVYAIHQQPLLVSEYFLVYQRA